MPNQVDINECLDHYTHYYRHVRNLYLYVATTRGTDLSADEPINYPFISEARIKDFLNEVGLVKGANTPAITAATKCSAVLKIGKNPAIDQLSLEEIDEIFKATNVEYEEDDENPDDLLNRVEVIEFFMRFAV
jgi:hypothetical protein